MQSIKSGEVSEHRFVFQDLNYLANGFRVGLHAFKEGGQASSLFPAGPGKRTVQQLGCSHLSKGPWAGRSGEEQLS